ncbi:MAG: hypothetical protein AUG74_00680 [Bacteroidetes bacterium 13_1_20CM_4_60_6]|nr:MAG: hypothetical protein AUG74_00680 [Bacteroidetes bacterium 13_1_20CM_4_60_6]
MDFALTAAVPVLERTPEVLRSLLDGLPDEWTRGNEGPGTWTIREVLAHLIHGENADWLPRVEHLMEWGIRKPFPPFDRTFGFAERREAPVRQLLDEFAAARQRSVASLTALGLASADLAREGSHPEFGRVTLGQHLATWVAHDFTHISQIVRVMAVQYRDAVGPWEKYLRIVRISA